MQVLRVIVYEVKDIVRLSVMSNIVKTHTHTHNNNNNDDTRIIFT